jgi:PBSX family phage terminase large subunit
MQQTSSHNLVRVLSRLPPKAAAKLLEEAASLGRAAQTSAGASDPVFRGAAFRAQSITEHEWMLAGPSETGKTWAALWRLDKLLTETRNAQAALVRKVAADIGPTVLRTYKKVIERSQSGAHAYGGEKPEWYDYPSGSRLYIGGMDRPGKVLSGERDFVYVNQAEELSLEDWETLTTRTTGRGAVTDTPMLFGDCNPGPPTHWIINRPTLTVLHSKHEDNPSLFDEHGGLTPQGVRSMRILDNLTGVRQKRLRSGLWVAAEGTVYEFDRAIHLIDPFPVPASWARMRAIDFGYTNPFVCQWWAIDPDGRMYLYREIYMTHRTVKVHAKKIKELERWYRDDGSDNPEREYIAYTVADHDAEDRATLEEEGIGTSTANKAITSGIQKTEERLKVAGDGKSRLFVMRGALVERDEEYLSRQKQPVSTEQEFDMYMWPKGADGKPRKEVPLDMYNHGMDAMRYAVMKLDGGRTSSLVGAFAR